MKKRRLDWYAVPNKKNLIETVRVDRRRVRVHGGIIEEGEAMPWDLKGWGEIATALNVGQRTAQRWAVEEDNPLPIVHFRGNVYASLEDLRGWVLEQSK